MVDLTPGSTVAVVNPSLVVQTSAPGVVAGVWLKEGTPGAPGRSVTSVTRTSGTGAPGTTDVYTIAYSDSTTSTFSIYNGTNGRAVSSIARTSGTGAPGTTDTYTITYSDATTSTFTVTNGANGRSVSTIARTSGTGAAGTTDTYTITYSDATTSTFQVVNGANGRGISTVARTTGTGAPGTTDTYTITYSDASTSTFQVYNGANGTGSGDMLKSDNLFGLANYTTARSNLGLGSAALATAPSGAIVGTTDTQTLTNKTLTSPLINAFLDTNGKNMLTFNPVTNAVNYLRLDNNATGGSPTLVPVGSDTNVGLNVVPKGAGQLTVSAVPVVTTSGTQTLTNKTIGVTQLSGVIATGNLGTGTASSTTYLRGDGTWAAVSSGGGILTAPVIYNPTTVTTITTTSGTPVDVDATNLVITFTATSTRVKITLEGYAVPDISDGYSGFWCLRTGTTNIPGTAFLLPTRTEGPMMRDIYVSGLTVGNSYTYKWGHFSQAVSYNFSLKVGNNGSEFTSATVGPAVMSAWAA